MDEIFFAVKADETLCAAEPVELDIINARCRNLRRHLRDRPTLPLKSNNEPMSVEDLATGVQLPLYTCPFKACNFHTENRTFFLHHVAGGLSDDTHRSMIEDICGTDLPWMTRLDYVNGAVSVAERERWPRLGLSVTRRSLNLLCHKYNDKCTQCLSCFVCCQLRTTCEGYPVVGLKKPATESHFCKREIEFKSVSAICAIERESPGTLLNNCSYELWRRRYNNSGLASRMQHPWEPLVKPLSLCGAEKARHIFPDGQRS